MTVCTTGSLVRTLAGTLIAAVPCARVGDGVRVHTRSGRTIAGRVAAVERGRVAIVPFAPLDGVAAGDRVSTDPESLACVLGFGLLGRAIDAGGAPLDGRGAPRGLRRAVSFEIPPPVERRPVDMRFETGIAAIDGLLTLGRGARIGIFGAPGTGKTTLLEMVLRGAQADAIVVALIGERGREAQRWIERCATHAMIVCGTADRTASERVRAAEVAMAQAAYLRERGLNVLLVVDSLARYAAALRERANGLGEPPGRGGYPASVWAEFNRYLEAAGNGARGSVTLIATVLADADDERDPVCVAARAALDGHIVLSSALARSGFFPAIDVPASSSRTRDGVVDAGQRRDAAVLRETLALLAASEDLRAAGLASAGNVALQRAIVLEPSLRAFLQGGEPVAFGTVRARLRTLALEA